MNGKARLELLHDDRVARVVLSAPKANILDRAMIEDLLTIFTGIQSSEELCAIVITGDGPHFSFGASIEEHLPGEIEQALGRLGALLRRVATALAPVIAAVRGQCLGGGFELALACDLVIAEESAQLGVPEIRLGVFPPAASVLLPVRMGVAGASSMVLTGRSWSGAQSFERGLVARLVPDGTLDAAVEAWIEEDFLPRSPAALRYATDALRLRVQQALEDDLPAADRIYLEQLMKHPDAVEGINAFLEKRQPQWKRRQTV